MVTYRPPQLRAVVAACWPTYLAISHLYEAAPALKAQDLAAAVDVIVTRPRDRNAAPLTLADAFDADCVKRIEGVPKRIADRAAEQEAARSRASSSSNSQRTIKKPKLGLQPPHGQQDCRSCGRSSEDDLRSTGLICRGCATIKAGYPEAGGNLFLASLFKRSGGADGERRLHRGRRSRQSN